MSPTCDGILGDVAPTVMKGMPAAWMVGPAANGAKLAVKEINAAGGVLGKQIEFIVHDSQYKMDVTAQTAKQFIEEDKIQAMIGYTDTDSVNASGPTFQAAGIPFITVGATSPKIPDTIGDLMFLAAFGDNVQAAAGAEYALANTNERVDHLLTRYLSARAKLRGLRS